MANPAAASDTDAHVAVDVDENSAVTPEQENERKQNRRNSNASSNSHSSADFALEDFWDQNPPPPYRSVDGENVLAKSDKAKPRQNRGLAHWLRTIIRGRSFATIPIVVSVLWSCFAVGMAQIASRGYPKNGCKWFCSPLALDSTIHSYVGFALFLLLGFRVNESYQRYLDGLKIWTKIAGTVGSTSKYFLQAFPPGVFHSGDRERMLGWLVAFPVALKRELREQRDLSELKSILAPEDLAELQNARNMASHTLYVISAYIIKARNMEQRFPQTFLVHLINWIADLASAADTCMQIKRMPCAFSHIAHLRTFLLLWLILLPFTIVEQIGWGTPLIVAFITYGIVGVEMNAAELENPFGMDYNDIPLGMLTDQIIESVKETYRAGIAGSRRYVHAVGPVVPEEGEEFWLESVKKER